MVKTKWRIWVQNIQYGKKFHIGLEMKWGILFPQRSRSISNLAYEKLEWLSGNSTQPYLGSLKIKKYRKSILHFWGGGVGRRCAIGSWEHLKWEGTQFSVMTMMCFVSRHNHTHDDVCHVAQKTFAAISRKNAFICNDPHNNNRTC